LFLFRSANEEKLQILEDNRTYLEKFRTELRLAKQKEEQTLRNQMKTDLAYDASPKKLQLSFFDYLVILKMKLKEISHVKKNY
jgi:hypothetical protein